MISFLLVLHATPKSSLSMMAIPAVTRDHFRITIPRQALSEFGTSSIPAGEVRLMARDEVLLRNQGGRWSAVCTRLSAARRVLRE
ncbi:MAG: hypothetical protein VB131_08295 [Burkholderia gladioli]